MSVFDLDQKGQQALADDARLNPLDASQITPTAFTGTGKGIGMGVMKGGARVGQFVGLAGAVVPMAIDKITEGDNFSGKSLTDRYFDGLDETVNRAADYWTPNHAEVGKAGQVLGGLSEIILPMLAGGGNPAATATMVAGSQTAGTGTDLVKQGVDGKTAGTVAAIQGISAYAGFKIPFLGNTLAARMGSGAAGNLVTNAGGAAVQSKVLAGAGYDDQAKQFDPLNAEARAIDILTGVVFGGFAHWAAGKGKPITPSDADAVLTASNAKHFQQDTAPGIPADAKASSAHQSALEQAIEQLVRGERVSVPDSILAAEFVRPVPPAESQVAGAVREKLPPSMRWAPSERLAQVAPEQRRALRYDAPELNEYAATIEQRYGLPGGLINALKNAGEKSNSTQVSPVGAAGVMQFMPENLKKYGVTDATDPVQMIDAAGRYLRDTMKQYGGNIEAVIADYNGGPRQARRVMNGEPPKAAETVAYLDRVRAYMERQDRPYTREASTEAFAEKTGRRVAVDAENRPIFEDGTAFPREAISDFYDQRVAHLGNGDTSPMPDVLFRIGEVDNTTAAGLRDFLPGFTDDLREARISAQAIRHIHDSRPGIAREVLQRLDDGTLYADEVLPNPKDRARALVVLKDAGPTGESIPKHLSQVLEVSANGKGIDVVTAMTARDGSLNKARELKRKIIEERGGTVQDGGAAYPSSSLADSLANQPHAAADFPTFDQNRETSIAQPAFSASDRLRLQGGSFDITEALTKAGEIFNSLRASGKGIDAFFADKANLEGLPPEINNLLIALSENAGNPKRMAELLGRYADSALKPESAGMNPGDLIADVVDSMRSDPAAKARQQPDSPTFAAASEAIAKMPDMLIRMEDGTDVPASEFLSKAQSDLESAKSDSRGFLAAITCFLRH